MHKLNCRFCSTPLSQTLVDLGLSPLANSYLKSKDDALHEKLYPLKVYVCQECWLVQLPEFVDPHAIFKDYAYFSSFSSSWLEHCRKYAEKMIARLQLNPKSLVIEVASNDGYLLQFFKEAQVGVHGIEPAENVAQIAIDKGIPTTTDFLSEQSSIRITQQTGKADLVVANNVLAHVPDINDFVKGIKNLLKPQGICTFEFPHLLNMIRYCEFDTIYHEHFSYLSLRTVSQIVEKHGMKVFDVEEIKTHGGSLRVYCQLTEGTQPLSENVAKLVAKEVGLENLETYIEFQQSVLQIRSDFLRFMADCRRDGLKVVGYGAAAKGNTFLNFCGASSETFDYVVDLNPAKQGCLLPGVHIPIHSPQKLRETQPDKIVILPWNLTNEIIE